MMKLGWGLKAEKRISWGASLKGQRPPQKNAVWWDTNRLERGGGLEENLELAQYVSL